MVPCGLSRKVESSTHPRSGTRLAYLADSPWSGSVHGRVWATGERERARDLIGDTLGVGLSVDGLDVQALCGSPGEDLLWVLALEFL